MQRGPLVTTSGSSTGKAFVFGPVLIAAGALAGCSLIGYGIGSKIDASNRKLVAVDGWNLERVEAGAQIHVLLRSGGEVAGAFEGVDYSAAEYSARYDAWRGGHADFAALEVGGGVEIVDVGGKELSGTFVAFDDSSLVVVRGDTGTVDRISYRKIDRISAPGGATWAGARLAELASQGRLPLRSCLVMENRPRVPMEQIDRVEMLRAGSKARVVGFLVGAAVDAVLVAALIHPTPTPPPTSSCPYVYSFDGRRYVHEGDAFPGSMFQASQATDRLVLSHLHDAHDPVRLRLANELDEVEYVDEIKLMAVDGPSEAVVTPLPSGRFRALSAPVAPIRAADLSGRPVLENGEPWVGSPLSDAAGAPAGMADGIVLEFPRPAASRSVTLAFRIEPLPWASHVLWRVLQLQGRDFPGWYARTNADAVARAEFMGAFRREGHLRLQVWSGADWRDEGYVPVHQAAEMSLEGIAGETLRIRLVASTPGLWKVEGVLADFGAETALDVIELPAASARTAAGEDVRNLLAAVDGRRLVMRHGDSVDLAFVPPSPRPGRRRTFVLKAAGYYSILVPAEGEPQTALFARLVKEPGAFRWFSREVLRADIEGSVAQASRPAARQGSD
jgi:hypothetical protein